MTGAPLGYEIWDIDRSVLVWEGDTEAAALAFVREVLDGSPEGEKTVECFGLERVEADGEMVTTIAASEALVKLAREAKP